MTPQRPMGYQQPHQHMFEGILTSKVRNNKKKNKEIMG